MTSGQVLVLAVTGLLGACTASHLGDECSEPADCEPPFVCDWTPPDGIRRTCVATCDVAIDGRLCENGATCLAGLTAGRCTAGGSVAEGEISRIVSGVDCAFGLMGARDFAAEPMVLRCRRACEWEGASCRAEEVCDSVQSCRQRCAGVDGSPFGTPCDPPAVCSWGGTLCVSPRRLARADCDGDGDLEQGTGDCSPSFRCDAEAIGGCGFVPAGEL